jgi:hypothetical protein
MKKNNIRLKSVQGHILRWISEAQAWTMVSASTARWRDSDTVQMNMLDRREQHSSASITASEMGAIGLGLGESKTATMTETKKSLREYHGFDAEDYIERAHDKLKWYPLPSEDIRSCTVVPVGALELIEPCPA